MTYNGNSLLHFILLESNIERKATVLWPREFKWDVNKVMMHGIAYAWQSFKLLLFDAGCSHNISVTLQAVQTQRRLYINESAFHLTLHVLHTKVSFSRAFSWISCSQIKEHLQHNFPSWTWVIKEWNVLDWGVNIMHIHSEHWIAHGDPGNEAVTGPDWRDCWPLPCVTPIS